MARATPPSSPTKVSLPHSPLHQSIAAFAPPAQTSPPARAPPLARTSLDGTSDDDELPPASTQRGHRTRPSASGLLGGDDDLLDPASRARQERLRDYEHEPSALQRITARIAQPFRGIARFVKANEGLLLIACAQVFFACMNCIVKLLQEEVALPVWETIAIRMIFTFAGCYAYLRWQKDPNPFLGPPGVRLLLCARGVVGFFGLFPGYYALQYLSLSDATTISFLSPVLVGLLAWVLLREPYSRLEALVGLTSLLGTVFIAKPAFLFPHTHAPTSADGDEDGISTAQRERAVGVALIGVFGAAGAYLLIRKIGKRASPLHSISYFSFYCVVVSCLYPLVFDAPPVFKLEKRFFALILPIGIFGFLAQALLTMGLQREKAGRGTLAVYSNLLFAMLLERLVFHNTPDVWSLLGASIIIGGAVRVALDKRPVVSASGTISRRASAASLRRASVGAAGVGGVVRRVAAVGPVVAAEEGRKVKVENGDEAARPLRLSSEPDDSDDELYDDELGTDEEVDIADAGGSGIAAARGLDAER
ncbi:hypothetical protein JCM10207_007625 [Rhodosporidiobolus poonsookiae]